MARELSKPLEESHGGNEKSSDLAAEDSSSAEESQAAEITRVPEHMWRNTKPATVGESGTAVLVATGPRTQKADRHVLNELNAARSEMSMSDCNLQEPQGTIPTRFAINSHRLMTLLAKCTKQEIQSSRNSWVRPFKYLMHFEKEIRAGYKEISDRYNNLSSSTLESEGAAASDMAALSANQEQGNENARPEYSSDIEGAARDKALWSCVIEFMDTDMRDIFDMRAKAATDDLREIDFEDLWCLYNPGDLVYHKFTVGGKSRHRAYRVLSVTGGRSILDTANRSDEGLKDYGEKFRDSFEDLDDRLNEHRNMRGRASGKTPFVIDCFFLDFDGDRWGPRPRRFVIPEYTGTRSITQLAAVPVRFMPGWANIETEMVDRGRRFVDIAKGAHRIYTGRGHPDKWLETSQYEVCWKTRYPQI